MEFSFWECSLKLLYCLGVYIDVYCRLFFVIDLFLVNFQFGCIYKEVFCYIFFFGGLMGEDVKFEKIVSRLFEFKFVYFGSEMVVNLKFSYNKQVFCFYFVVNFGYVGFIIWKIMY